MCGEAREHSVEQLHCISRATQASAFLLRGFVPSRKLYPAQPYHVLALCAIGGARDSLDCLVPKLRHDTASGEEGGVDVIGVNYGRGGFVVRGPVREWGGGWGGFGEQEVDKEEEEEDEGEEVGEGRCAAHDEGRGAAWERWVEGYRSRGLAEG